MSTDDYDKFLDWNVGAVVEFLEDNEQYGDDWSEQKKGLNDLLAEVRRLREELVTYADFVFWVDIEHNISFDEYERRVGLK